MSSRQNGTLRAGKAPSQRQLRVGEEIRHTLADLFRRGDFRDPELQDLNVTVTEVRVSPDLRAATAFVTPLGGEHMDETLAALKRASAFLRGQIARTINLRYAPTISFEADISFAYAGHIGELLNDPEVARDLAPPEEEEEASAADEEDGVDEEGGDGVRGA